LNVSCLSRPRPLHCFLRDASLFRHWPMPLAVVKAAEWGIHVLLVAPQRGAATLILSLPQHRKKHAAVVAPARGHLRVAIARAGASCLIISWLRWLSDGKLSPSEKWNGYKL